VHVAFLHPALDLSGTTERALASAAVAHGLGWRVSVIARPGSRAPALARRGVELFDDDLPRRMWRQPFALLRTRALLRGLAPDLLHVTDERLAGLASALATSLRIPYVLEVARPVREPLLRPHPHLRAIVLPCRTFVERAVNRGRAPRGLLRVVEHGPDLERTWRPRPRDGECRPCVGALGHLDLDHGTSVLLDAARFLKSEGRAFSVLVLGEGPQEDELRRAARRLDLAAEVTITAPAFDALADVLDELDLFVSCTLEGSAGWLAHQAFGAGLPSIFSAVSSSFPLVEDGRSALLVERADARQLAGSIAALLDDPPAAQALGRRARSSMLALRPAETYARELAGVYEAALATRASG